VFFFPEHLNGEENSINVRRTVVTAEEEHTVLMSEEQ
jgi:hypothetical protein